MIHSRSIVVGLQTIVRADSDFVVRVFHVFTPRIEHTSRVVFIVICLDAENYSELMISTLKNQRMPTGEKRIK